MIAVALAVIVIHAGQTRWLLPGAAKVGETVTCVRGARRTSATIPPPVTGAVSGTDAFSRGGPQLQIATHRNGSMMVACDTLPSAPGPHVDMPYVIGQNGVGLLIGAVTRARLEKLYGRPSSERGCRATWRDVGLVVAYAHCRFLHRVTVTGSTWSTLAGSRIGDSLAKLLWTQQGARRIRGTHDWLLATGVQYRSRLVARMANGKVIAFVATVAEPPT